MHHKSAIQGINSGLGMVNVDLLHISNFAQTGNLALAAVTGLAVENFGYALFSVFMFQQLTLMMAIPPLLVLGSPGTLLLRATRTTAQVSWCSAPRTPGYAVAPHGGCSARGWRCRYTWPRFTVCTWRTSPIRSCPPSPAIPSSRSGFLVAGMLFTIDPVVGPAAGADEPRPLCLPFCSWSGNHAQISAVVE